MSTEQVDLEIPHSGSSQVILGCTKLTFKSNHYTHLWKPSFILFFCLHGFFNSEYLIQGALYSTWVFMTSFFHIELMFLDTHRCYNMYQHSILSLAGQESTMCIYHVLLSIHPDDVKFDIFPPFSYGEQNCYEHLPIITCFKNYQNQKFFT